MSKSIKTRSRTATSKSKSRGMANDAKALEKSERDRFYRKRRLSEGTTQVAFPLEGGWVVVNGYEKGFIYITESKREAVRVAKTIAYLKGLRYEVHSPYGTVLESKKFRKPARTKIAR